MCHVAPPLESAKFKFELANEVAVLESANFELSNDKGLAWYQQNFHTSVACRCLLYMYKRETV